MHTQRRAHVRSKFLKARSGTVAGQCRHFTRLACLTPWSRPLVDCCRSHLCLLVRRLAPLACRVICVPFPVWLSAPANMQQFTVTSVVLCPTVRTWLTMIPPFRTIGDEIGLWVSRVFSLSALVAAPPSELRSPTTGCIGSFIDRLCSLGPHEFVSSPTSCASRPTEFGLHSFKGNQMKVFWGKQLKPHAF